MGLFTPLQCTITLLLQVKYFKLDVDLVEVGSLMCNHYDPIGSTYLCA